MNKLLLLTIISFSVAGTVVADKDEDGFAGPNRLRHNEAVTTYRENERGIPAYVEGVLSAPVAAGSEIGAAISFFEGNKAAFSMTNPSDELLPTRIDLDDLGMRHIRFQQQYQGVKVIGGELIAHFSASGVLKTVNGNYEPEIDLDVTPSIAPDEAVKIAHEDLKSFFGESNPGEAELVVFPWEGENYLCWRLFLYSETPMGRWEYFVDAKNGEVVFKANRIMNTDAIGTGTSVMGDPRNHIDTDFNGSTYRMIDNTRQTNNDPHGHSGQMPDGNYLQTNIAGASLPGSVASDADNVWDDTAVQSPAVDGHVYSALVYDWWLREFNRNSYTNTGSSMLTSVNYYGEGDNNAYWNGSRIVIWSWSSGWRSLAGCPDVIAHEWGHAVTEYTSNLIYQKEPGALNESFSDMMGAAFEFAHDSMDTPDWYMGENGQISGNGFRSMSDPHLFGDPDFYGLSDPYWIDVENCTPSWSNDYCGVHTNSGVGNKWFQLLSDGGTHYSVTVTGIAVENAMKVAYRANAFYWTSTTDYHEAALGTISAANDLDTSGAWTTQVSNAWNAVGVSTPGPSVAFSYPNGVPSVLAPAESTTFEVVVSGVLGGTPVSGSGWLHYFLDGGAYDSVPMAEISANYYEATLPAANCDSWYEFYVSADEVANGTFYDPDTTDPFWAIVATNVTTVFEDNFETDKGWTVSGDASDGQWDRGVPVGGGDRGDPPTDFDGSGRCYLTDNVDGNSDVDGGTTVLTSPAFDLSGGDAKIHYARWYSNNFGNAPFSDVFEIYISNDNGSNWTLVETVGPVDQASGGWYEQTFWVSDFVTPSSQMRLRFDASDLGEGSVVEAAVDDVTVTRYECDISTPQILTDSLPDWTANSFYSQQLQATGGSGALTWSDKYGNLAGTGLTLSATGLLSGTPITSGQISFTAEVTDEAFQSDEKLFSFFINEALAIVTDSLPDWTVGQSYNQQLQASGGTGTKTWSDKNADLVGTGLSLSIAGVVSGVPNTEGLISFTAYVNDEGGDSEEKPFTLTISPAVAITTDSLPNGTEGELYSQQLQASGGTGAKTWTDKNSDLMGTGLSLTAGGLLSGTPVDSGSVSFTARAEDISGSVDEKLFTLFIEPAYICGDVDGDGSGPNVADLTYLVDYIFKGGPPPPVMEAADVDGFNGVNISDLTALVDYLFRSGELNCP